MQALLEEYTIHTPYIEEYTIHRHLTLYQKRKKNLGVQETFNSGCRKGAQVEKLISERCKGTKQILINASSQFKHKQDTSYHMTII